MLVINSVLFVTFLVIVSPIVKTSVDAFTVTTSSTTTSVVSTKLQTKYPHRSISSSCTGNRLFATSTSSANNVFQLTIDLPPSNSDVQVQMTIESLLSVPSELIVVRYKVPFGINIEPKKQFAYVTADGPGGERVGDILRYTSHFTMGLPRGDGLGTTFASFAGSGLKWQCSMFNIMSVNRWEQVINALVSNTIDRTDEVVFIFERPLNNIVPPELQ